MGTAKGDGYTVTPRDLELVVNAINCTRLPFEIEYDKLSSRLGYKNAQSAKAAWNALKKKLDKVAEGAPVVPSLTIEPEPLRRSAGTPMFVEQDSRKAKKGKQVVLEPSSETSEDESGAESDVPPPPKPSKKRKQARVVDDDGNVSMSAGPSMARSVTAASKSNSKRKADRSEGSRHRRQVPTVYSTSASDMELAAEPKPKTPRKKLKRKFTQLAVSDQVGPKDKGRKKAFEAFGVRDEEDEDDEEPVIDAPPAYVKRESEGRASMR